MASYILKVLEAGTSKLAVGQIDSRQGLVKKMGLNTDCIVQDVNTGIKYRIKLAQRTYRFDAMSDSAGVPVAPTRPEGRQHYTIIDAPTNTLNGLKVGQVFSGKRPLVRLMKPYSTLHVQGADGVTYIARTTGSMFSFRAA